MPTRAVGVGLVRGDRGRGLGDAAGGGGDASAAGVLARGGERGALDGEVRRRGERARRAAAARERVRARERLGSASPIRAKNISKMMRGEGGRATSARAARRAERTDARPTPRATEDASASASRAARRAPRGVRSRGTREGKGEGSRGRRRSSLARAFVTTCFVEYRRRARDLALFRRRTQKNRANGRDASPVITTATVRIPRIPARARVALLSSAIGSTPNPSAPRPTRRSVDGASNRAGLVGGQVDGRFYPPQPPRRRFPPGRDPPLTPHRPRLRTDGDRNDVRCPQAPRVRPQGARAARARQPHRGRRVHQGRSRRVPHARDRRRRRGEVQAQLRRYHEEGVPARVPRRRRGLRRRRRAGARSTRVSARDAPPPPPRGVSEPPFDRARIRASKEPLRRLASPPARRLPTPPPSPAPGPSDAHVHRRPAHRRPPHRRHPPPLPPSRVSRTPPPPPPSYPRTAHHPSNNKNRWVRSCGSARP